MIKRVIMAASCIIAPVMLIVASSCATAPNESPPSEPSVSGSSGSTKTHIDVIQKKEPYPGNHGIATTRATPEPGDNITMSSSLMIKLTMDDLVEKSDTILIGKVVDIFPSRQVDKPPWIVITDVVIEVERYLYGQPQSAYIAVMVPGGRVGESVFLVDSQPVFNLGEEVALFLYRLQTEVAPPPPDGFERAEYYMVTGSMQGKLGYKDGTMVTLEGNSVSVSEVEHKITSIHGGE